MYPCLTSDLLTDVRRSGMLPDSAPSGVSDADILAAASKEMWSRLVPLVLSVREEFYVQQSSQALVANQQLYRIPPRAIGTKLRDVYLVQSNGSQQRLTRLTPEAAVESNWPSTTGVYPWAYYVEQDGIMLVPVPSTSGNANIELKYLLRPGTLITHNDNQTPHVSGVLYGAAANGGVRITHTGSGAFNPNQSLDIVSVKAPYRTVMISVTPFASGTTGGLRYFDVAAGSVPSDFTTANFGGGAGVGAMISPAESTPVIQLPPELHQLLYQRTLCRIMQSIGDMEAVQVAEANAAQMERDALTLISNRVEGDAKKVIGRLLSSPRRRYGRWY